MTAKHPIIAVSGSSGAGRGIVRDAFNKIFQREGYLAAWVDGSSFHKYDREEMREAIATAAKNGNPNFSHFGMDANLLDELANLYKTYGETGTGKRRFYVHDEASEEEFEVPPGKFTEWEELPPDTDCLVYEGLHGWVKADGVDLGQHLDLRIGVVPIINLEWIKKIHLDTRTRGYSQEAVVEMILRRMPDYVHYVVPQFRRSDINFQRVPVVDTSYPMIARDIPTEDESVVVIRFRKPEELGVDFPYLLKNLPGAWMSR
ncbi:MAG: phosphoribulokinase, partial [Rhodospirillales bacterium]|nr:phosphoribulokinase [Rhodospirillales bacterium]